MWVRKKTKGLECNYHLISLLIVVHLCDSLFRKTTYSFTGTHFGEEYL